MASHPPLATRRRSLRLEFFGISQELPLQNPVVFRFWLIFTSDGGVAFRWLLHGCLSADSKRHLRADEIKAMTAAYEAELLDIDFVDRDDPITEVVATATADTWPGASAIPRALKGRAKCHRRC